jgi:leucyl/phenylalanyl-tRNA--protein transferase
MTGIRPPSFPDLRGRDDAPEAWFGGRLDRAWTLAAYRAGFFPWFEEGEPLTWWSSRRRMVVPPSSLRVSRSLARTIRRGRFDVAFDTDFDGVVERCAAKRGPGREHTWITRGVRAVFRELQGEGIAHSVECRRGGRLVGGVYGASLGGCFFGESMFADERDASKVALVALCAHLAAWGFDVLDCQVPSPHLARLGGVVLSRTAFLRLLDASLARPDRRGRWTLDPALFPVSDGRGRTRRR